MTQASPRITIDPSICHGKPCIRGMRYPVETVLDWLAAGMDIGDIIADYPDLEREDVLAWQEYVEGRVSLREFEGDHFFIDKQRQEVVAAVGEILTSAIEGREALGSTRGQQC